MRIRSYRASTLATVLLLALSILALTPGCGGGGGGGGSALGTTGQVTASSDTTSSGGSTTTTPVATGDGTGRFSGKITNEMGLGLSGVSLAARATTPAAERAKKGRVGRSTLAGSTDSNGQFDIAGFYTDEPYELTVSRTDRKTLRTIFTVDPNQPDISVILVAPKGSGEVQFTMPRILHLNKPSMKQVTGSTNSTGTLTWEASDNPGFMAYVVFSSEFPNRGIWATQVAAKLAATDTSYEASVPPGKMFYYRVYEKILVPELGTFLMAGTNEVIATAPGIKSVVPSGVDLATTQNVRLEFSVPMDHASVEAAFKLTTGAAGAFPSQTVTGTASWSGNTFTFTPAQALPYARTMTASLGPALDVEGNEMPGGSWNFVTTTGYKVAQSWGQAELGAFARNAVAVDPDNNVYVGSTYEVPMPGGSSTRSQIQVINADGTIAVTPVTVNLTGPQSAKLMTDPAGYLYVGPTDVTDSATSKYYPLSKGNTLVMKLPIQSRCAPAAGGVLVGTGFYNDMGMSQGGGVVKYEPFTPDPWIANHNYGTTVWVAPTALAPPTNAYGDRYYYTNQFFQYFYTFTTGPTEPTWVNTVGATTDEGNSYTRWQTFVGLPYRKGMTIGPNVGGTYIQSPAQVAVDEPGNVYVIDSDSRKIFKCSPTGAYLATVLTWTRPADSSNGYGNITGVGNPYVDRNGFLYLQTGTVLQKLSPAGAFVTQLSVPSGGLPDSSRAAAVTADGTVYISGNGTVDRYIPWTGRTE